jgi:hypothetical protein
MTPGLDRASAGDATAIPGIAMTAARNTCMMRGSLMERSILFKAGRILH